MRNLADCFENLTGVYHSARSRLYRAVWRSDGTPVIVKLLGAAGGYDQNRRALERELLLARQVPATAAVAPLDLVETREGCALVLRDVGGVSLREIFDRPDLDLPARLQIAIRIADALQQVHAHGVIHKDVNPDNIVVVPESWDVRLTDFGIATTLASETQSAVPPTRLEGTLPYVSPEQTGRMNRFIDYRTDIYSFGVTLYELFARQLPFQASDPIGWIHSHIALDPEPLHRRAVAVPRPISDIVMKMLAKNAEDRYESAAGIRYDLEFCARCLRESGQVQDFVPGRRDRSGRFQIPQRLYGREAQVARLLEVFDEAAGGDARLLLVTGFSGVGKSSLVHEIHRPIVARRGLFASSKFDQFQRDRPLSALVDALRSLVAQILTEDAIELELLRDRLIQAAGMTGQMILDVLPELEALIGPQPPMPAMGPAEAQARFMSTFQKFISELATADRPLVIFLDDLQWADSASLEFLKSLLGGANIRHLLMIGAYRDNEVDLSHPLTRALDEIRGTARIDTIELKPLELEHLCALLADTLGTEERGVVDFAGLILERTQGNPFFAGEFLKNLYHDGLLSFDANADRWTWDLAMISARGFTDNVVEFLVERIRRLEDRELRLLHRAACVGNRFSAHDLFMIAEETAGDVRSGLRSLVSGGFLIPQGAAAEMLRGGPADDSQFDRVDLYFSFQHDRVQQAAYTVFRESEREQIHLKIGRLLLADRSQSDTLLFQTLGQLNRCHHLVTDPDERKRLAELNCAAGRKANRSIAYLAAIQYLSTARSLLGDDAWQTDYELALDIHAEEFLALSSSGRHDEAAVFYERTLPSAKPEDRFPFYLLRMQTFVAIAQFSQNLDLGIQALGELGFPLPAQTDADAVSAAFQSELQKFQELLRDRPIETVIKLPETDDPRIVRAMETLMYMFDAGFFGNPGLLSVLIFKLANLSLENGNSYVSSFAYAWVGLPLIYVLEDYSGAYRFGRVAVTLAEKFGNPLMLSRSYHALGTFTGFFGESLENCVAYLKKGRQYAVDVGDINFAVYAASLQNRWAFYLGHRLPDVLREAEESLHFMKKVNNQPIYEFHSFLRSLIFSLQGDSPRHDLLAASADEEAALFEKWQSVPLHTIFFSILKLFAGTVHEDYAAAERYGELAQENMLGLKPAYDFIHIPYLRALAALRASTPSPAADSDREAIVADALRQLKLWTEGCPANFEQKYLLVRAEQARVAGRTEEALDLYERAIAAAAEHGFLSDEALANDLCARFWLDRGRPKLAAVYLNAAVDLYELWGLQARARSLRESYPECIAPRPGDDRESTIPESTTASKSLHSSGNSAGEALDLVSILKASRTLAGEIRFDTLLERMMDIVLENAGARSGRILLENAGRLTIAAVADLDGKADAARKSSGDDIESVDDAGLALSIVRLVSRSRKALVVNDAITDANWAGDPHVAATRTRSILCAPILRQSRLIGVIYLENNQAPGVFTPARLEVLEMLSSQIAISLENATLYRNLENKVEERTLQLEAKTEQLEKLYKDVLEIKARQDCDFYLTSLLVEPLGANRARDTGVIIDFLVDQKKKFHFRGQLKSIGGDICGADTIVLQGETYTAFLNADAMGKSIQGAAGALIVGSIFDAILKRSKLQQTETNKYPEAWLKEAFVELQKVFESFRGGMMISLILGLICNRTGTFYHINAEYPCPVLLRRGAAQFIASTPFMRVGIGPEFLAGPGYRPLRVEVMQLEHEDILLSGSDGRDDILMEIAGDAQMNRDDSQFLRVVQTHGGDLDAVFAALQELGDLSDDISLMRARLDLPHRAPPRLGTEQRALVRRYREENDLAKRRLLLRELDDSGVKCGWLTKRLAIDACRGRQYETAMAYAEEYCRDYPVDDSILFLSAQLNAKVGNTDAATALADRLLNRHPESSAYQSLRRRASQPASERPR